MTASLFLPPRFVAVNESGTPRAGSKWYFYEVGTTTAKTVYSDAALSTPRTQPVVANSAGEVGPIYVDGAVKVSVYSSGDVLLYTEDNIPAATVTVYPLSEAETDAGLTAADVDTNYPVGNVRRYGADPTGATTASEAIQAAIDTMVAAGGGEVLIPSGTYKLTESLDARGASEVIIRSDGFATLVQHTNDTPVMLFGAVTGSLPQRRSGLENLYFTYNTAQTVLQTNAIGLKLWYSATCHFRNLWFGNCHSAIEQATDKGTCPVNVVFECTFDLIYVYGFTGTGIKLKPVDTGGTPNNWGKVYVNGGGNDVLDGVWLEGQADHFDALNIENMVATNLALLFVSGSGSGVTIDHLHLEKAVADSSCRGLIYFGVNSLSIGAVNIHSTEFDNAVVPITKIFSFFDGTLDVGTLKLTDTTLTDGATIQLLSAFNGSANPAKRVRIGVIQDLDGVIADEGDTDTQYITRLEMDTPAYQTAEYAAAPTPDFWSGWVYDVTLTGDIAVGVPLVEGRRLGKVATFIFRQDGTGGRAVTWDAVFVVNSRVNQTASAVTTIRVMWDGAKWREVPTPVITGSFTGTLTGCTSSPTGTVEYSISGDVVTLEIPAISATSNTTAATVTGMPTIIRPAAAQTMVAITTDNGTTTFGKLIIGTDGVITLHVGVSATFTNSGTKGIAACTVTYRLS